MLSMKWNMPDGLTSKDEEAMQGATFWSGVLLGFTHVTI
jgi:hypothetical protein